jgi:hypothetical protein
LGTSVARLGGVGAVTKIVSLLCLPLLVGACQPAPFAVVANETNLYVTFEITSFGGSSPGRKSVPAGGQRAIEDELAGCVDMTKTKFGVYNGSVVPAGKVIGTRDKEWCKGTWTIELLPAPAAGQVRR